MIDVSLLFDSFALPFVQRALLVVSVFGVVAGVIGVLIHLRRLEFVADGMVHAMFPGLVVGFLVAGKVGVLPGALLAGAVAAVLLAVVSRLGVRGDAAVAVLLAASFGVGVLLISARSSFVGSLEALLFGSVFALTDTQVLQVCVTAAVALVLVVVSWRRQVFLAFDSKSFAASGFSVFRTNVVLNVAVAFAVVAGASALGNLLVLGVLLVPAAAARVLSNRLGVLVGVSVAVAVGGSLLGVLLSVQVSLSGVVSPVPGAVLVLCVLGVFVCALLARFGVWVARRLWVAGGVA